MLSQIYENVLIDDAITYQTCGQLTQKCFENLFFRLGDNYTLNKLWK